MKSPDAHPIASPIASTATSGYGCNDGPSRENSPAKGWPQRGANYLTRARLDQIDTSLSQLDWSVLGFVSEVRLATSRQLMRRFWSTREMDPSRARSGREALKRLANDKVLERLPRQIGGVRAGSDGHVYAVGSAGVKLLARRGLRLRHTGIPGDRYIRHTLTISEAVVALSEAERAGLLELLEIQTEPRCHRSFLTGFGSSLTLKPDLFIRVGVGAFEDRYFVEVDLATEAAGTIEQKLKRYGAHFASREEQTAHGVYPGVLWLVPDERRAAQMCDFVARGRSAAGMHEIQLAADLVRFLSAGGEQ